MHARVLRSMWTLRSPYAFNASGLRDRIEISTEDAYLELFRMLYS